MNKKILIILLIVIVLELTLFNVNSYRVLNSNSKKEYSKEDFEYVYTEEEDEVYIKIDNINTEIKTIHIELDTEEAVDYQVLYTDATSSSLKELPRKKYIDTCEKSKYIPCYLSGESKLIGIKVFSDTVDFEKIKAAGVEFVILRHTNVINYHIQLRTLNKNYLLFLWYVYLF